MVPRNQFGGDAHGSGDYSRIVASHPSHFRLLSETIRACSDYIIAGGDVNEAENYISPTVRILMKNQDTQK